MLRRLHRGLLGLLILPFASLVPASETESDAGSGVPRIVPTGVSRGWEAAATSRDYRRPEHAGPGLGALRCRGSVPQRGRRPQFPRDEPGMTASSNHSVESFALSPHDPNVLFRCSGEARAGRSFGFIHGSRDGGKTWRLLTEQADFIGNGETRYMGEMIAVDPFDPNTVVAASFSRGVFASHDGGATGPAPASRASRSSPWRFIRGSPTGSMSERSRRWPMRTTSSPRATAPAGRPPLCLK